MKHREEAFFSFVFPCKLLNELPTRCQDLKMFIENWILQNLQWSFWCFHHQKELAHS